MTHAEYRDKVIRRQIRLMHDRGIWARPGDSAAAREPAERPERSAAKARKATRGRRARRRR